MRPVVDHVPFATSDLDALVLRFESLGFDPDYGGVHPEKDTEMAQLVLPDGSYLELVGPAGDDPGYWPAFVEADAGPAAWCVETGSVHGECQRVIDHDVEVHGPVRGRRTRPDGTRVEWDHAFLGPPEETLLPFVVSDRTPREYRVPDSDLYGAPVSGVGLVVLATDDLDAAVDQFARLYRLPEPETDYDDRFGELATFPGQGFALCEPVEGPVRERVERFGPCPATVLLGADVDQASHRYPLAGGRSWFDRRVRFFEGFDARFGVVDRR